MALRAQLARLVQSHGHVLLADFLAIKATNGEQSLRSVKCMDLSGVDGH